VGPKSLPLCSTRQGQPVSTEYEAGGVQSRSGCCGKGKGGHAITAQGGGRV